MDKSLTFIFATLRSGTLPGTRSRIFEKKLPCEYSGCDAHICDEAKRNRLYIQGPTLLADRSSERK